MSEFKFIRGKYTNEKIFNSDYKDCLFACDKNGNDVSLDAVNNEEFQEKIVGLSPDRLSEIYTIRPSQFTVGATGKPGDTYAYDFKVKDDSIPFTNNVITAAQERLKNGTTALISNGPNLILSGAAENVTSVNFAFGNKTFTRNLTFNVTGKLKEITYKQAQGFADEAYPTTSDGKINYDNTVKKTSKVFNTGCLQKEVTPVNKNIVLNSLTVSKVASYSQIPVNIDLASIYIAGSDCKILKDSQLEDFITYSSDDLSFEFYSKTPPQGVEEDNLIKKEEYYKLCSFTVKPRNGKIIKGFSDSYVGCYILENDDTSLRQITDSDLIVDKISVYSRGDYYIYNKQAYENDIDDSNNYVMFSNEWSNSKDITNSNAYINNKGIVSPQITTEVFRLIENDTLKVTATQSD